MNNRIIGFTLLAGLAAGFLAAAAPAFAADSPAAIETAVRQVFDQAIANVPGKSLIAAEVHYKPGEKSPPHRHEKSAFIMAYVVSGSIRSQVEGQPVRIYHAGESWYEDPGAHHVVSENASQTEPATLLAVFVVDTNHGDLTTMDK